ncbi:hypothetical protein RRG08_040162 [Elysia crispata]|uniref:Uncharacterized protein n=1 Tax=Elysia crispata TaxID=231223 RepID=A0AAE0XW01_9GAST|nr:hypothetical protein RRG08_040162 [Elysia crispata]
MQRVIPIGSGEASYESYLWGHQITSVGITATSIRVVSCTDRDITKTSASSWSGLEDQSTVGQNTRIVLLVTLAACRSRASSTSHWSRRSDTASWWTASEHRFSRRIKDG